MNQHVALSGRFEVSVIDQTGAEVPAVRKPNFIFNQAYDKLAAIPICDLFLACAAGVSGRDNSVISADVRTYTLSASTGTLTTATGGTFSNPDIGRIIELLPIPGFPTGRFKTRIISINSSTQAICAPRPTFNLINYVIDREYLVAQTALQGEIERTTVLSSAAGENGSVIFTDFKDNKRTFIFPASLKSTESDAGSLYTVTGATLSRVGVGRRFIVEDVGKRVFFHTDSEQVATVSALINESSVTVTGPPTLTVNQKITLINEIDEGDPTAPNAGVVAGTFTFGAGTVTRVTGRMFTSTDIGKKIYFVVSQLQATITAVNANGLSCTVSGIAASTLPEQQISVHGYIDYFELGCSESSVPGANINMRVAFTSPPRTQARTPLSPATQLKVSYTLRTRPSPSVITPLALGPISTGGQYNGAGNCVCETFALSSVNADGTTNISQVELEPYYAGFVAVSMNAEPLAPLSLGPQLRTSGVAYAALTAGAYVTNQRNRSYAGTFGLSEAISTVASPMKSIMHYSPAAGYAGWRFLFTGTGSSAGVKDSSHTLSFTFKKTWDFDID